MKKTLFALLAGVAMPTLGFAFDEAAAKARVMEDVKNIVQSPEIIAAIKAQNAAHAGMDEAAVIAKDNVWRAETKATDQPMVSGVLGNAVSAKLKELAAGSEGFYTEVFVMDNLGMNVGQSDMTSDYWQGDEAKFQKSYGAGKGGMFMDEVEFDESTQAFSTQINVAVEDPETGDLVGAVTFGVSAE